jgi:hypothetical protein
MFLRYTPPHHTMHQFMNLEKHLASRNSWGQNKNSHDIKEYSSTPRGQPEISCNDDALGPKVSSKTLKKGSDPIFRSNFCQIEDKLDPTPFLLCPLTLTP